MIPVVTLMKGVDLDRTSVSVDWRLLQPTTDDWRSAESPFTSCAILRRIPVFTKWSCSVACLVSEAEWETEIGSKKKATECLLASTSTVNRKHRDQCWLLQFKQYNTNTQPTLTQWGSCWVYCSIVFFFFFFQCTCFTYSSYQCRHNAAGIPASERLQRDPCDNRSSSKVEGIKF